MADLGKPIRVIEVEPERIPVPEDVPDLEPEHEPVEEPEEVPA